MVGDTTPPGGRLVVRPLREGLVFGAGTWRCEVPDAVAGRVDDITGPRLFEQTDYTVSVRSREAAVSVEHCDPTLLRDLRSFDNGRMVHGIINFGAHVGRSEFSLRVGGQPEFDFEVEVFPTKLDYASDYEQLLAEVQEILTGLVLEYLRSTFRLGLESAVPRATHLEWFILLRHVVDDLERALRRVASHPQRALTREPLEVQAHRVRRPDTSLRRAVLREWGRGRVVHLAGGLAVPGKLRERRARPTLDTPEHRWLASQLIRIRWRLAWLRLEEAKRAAADRRNRTLSEIDTLERRIAAMAQLEPMAEAAGDPPPGFASLQLLSAPGYREAYRSCLILSLGLYLAGGPVRLSLKDLSLLYEYWCFLALLRLVAEEMGQAIPVHQLIAAEQRGLRVLLQRGIEHAVVFHARGGRKITVTYNPRFQGQSLLVPQQPDMVLTFDDPAWPTVRLVLDAKYRIDGSPEYIDRYGSPGPPDDAVNVLHRYRDAILELDTSVAHSAGPKRTVVQAAALFPYREEITGAFRRSRLWEALERLGVGALPLLPGDTEYLSQWLRATLRRGGWALADRAIPHGLHERAWDWRAAASEPVLVGVLRSGDEARHLAWIERERMYYTPRAKRQRRQYFTKWVAIYIPTALRRPGAVTHWAEVRAVEVVRRGDIRTPWSARRDVGELQVLYRLGEVRKLLRPIENRDASAGRSRFSTHRWTSRLAIDRATQLEELFLETEPEWRLYEDLQASGVRFYLEPASPVLPDPEDPSGRAWFVTDLGRVRYRGAAGFVLRSALADDRYYARCTDVLEALRHLKDR